MKEILYGIVLLSTVTLTYSEHHHRSLDSYDYSAGFVLPEATIEGERYILLGRETAGRDQGRFDSFGGSRNPEDGKDPMHCAARELFEEAILAATLDMDLKAVRDYIDLAAGHTTHIFAIHFTEKQYRNVLCLTKFSEEDVEKLQQNFAAAWRTAPSWPYKEKDALALVRYSDFEEAIRTSSSSKGVTLSGLVTGLSGEATYKTIELRSVLVRMMRCYLENYSYEEGQEEQIRFYTV